MREDKFILDEAGNPRPEPSLAKWSEWFRTANRKIAYTEIGEARVSTVFLGLDHSFGEGPPRVFETLVFEGPLDGEMVRYSTREGALAGHDLMVERVRKAMQPEN